MGDLAVCQRATFHCLESMPRMHGYPIGKDSGTITQLSEARIPAPSVSSAFDFHLFSSMRTLCSAWFLFPYLLGSEFRKMSPGRKQEWSCG